MEGDITAGEDPIVRAAAVEALGNMNGTIVAIDPDSGRILAMVNQKLALSAGAQPCSTIKVAVALAALSENVITKDTQVPLGKYWRVDLTTALAHSNNAYFEAVGRKLGFEKVSYYAHQFGLGELAGLEHRRRAPGHLPRDRAGREAGRRWQDVFLRREHFADPAATGGADGLHRQRRHAVLPAASDHARRGDELHAQGEAQAGHWSADSGDF